MSQRLLLREARADSASSTSTLYVPPSGLVFRALDGTPIARISRDAHGGIFEVYDDRQQPIHRISASQTPTVGAEDTRAAIARDQVF
jgi:hypothetical protein